MRAFIILGALVLIGCAKKAASPNIGCTDPSNTSSGITCEYLAQQDATWRPATDSPVGFSVVLTDAGYDNIQTGGFAAAQAQLAMLLKTGASCVRIDIGYDAWLSNQQNIQADITSLIDQIRRAGKCLIIADAAAERYRTYPLPWTQFQQAWIQRVKTLYALYKPDFYILVKEPGWYVPMVSDSLTNPDFQNLSTWVTLVQNLEAAAPNSKDGVAIEGGYSRNASAPVRELLAVRRGASGYRLHRLRSVRVQRPDARHLAHRSSSDHEERLDRRSVEHRSPEYRVRPIACVARCDLDAGGI